MLALDLRLRQRLIKVAARCVLCERRMRLEPDTGAQMNRIGAVGDLRAGRIAGQDLAVLVVEDDGRQRLRSQPFEFERPLQIVVMKQRLIRLIRIRRFVQAIRADRIEKLGIELKRNEHHVARDVLLRIRCIDLIATCQPEGQRDPGGQSEPPINHHWYFPLRVCFRYRLAVALSTALFTNANVVVISRTLRKMDRQYINKTISASGPQTR